MNKQKNISSTNLNSKQEFFAVARVYLLHKVVMQMSIPSNFFAHFFCALTIVTALAINDVSEFSMNNCIVTFNSKINIFDGLISFGTGNSNSQQIYI